MKLQAPRKCGEYQPLEGMKVSYSEVFQHCVCDSTIKCPLYCFQITSLALKFNKMNDSWWETICSSTMVHKMKDDLTQFKKLTTMKCLFCYSGQILTLEPYSWALYLYLSLIYMYTHTLSFKCLLNRKSKRTAFLWRINLL